LGFELAAAIVGLTLAGCWVDHHFDVGPWGLICGASLGVVGGMYNFIRQAVELSRLAEADRKKAQRGRGDDSSRTP
jgi:F0F1-type ATP synthase assembly protein I